MPTSDTEGPILSSLVRLAVPITLAGVLQGAYQLTDAFWVGRLGGHAVAAVSVSFPLIFLMIALGAGMAIAGSTLVAQYCGARNAPMVNHVAAQTLLAVGLASVICSLLGYSVAPGVLRMMGVGMDVLPAAIQFLRVSCAGLVFVFGFAMIQAVFRGVGEVRLPLLIVFVTVALNFGLDPLLIFGFGPIPGAGVAGAAFATIGTQSVAAIAGLSFLLSGRYGIHLRLGNFRPDIRFLRRALRLGFPASVEQTARALGLTAMTFLVAGFGTITVAAYGIGFNVLSFVLIPAMGLSMATSTLVGQSIGAGKVDRAESIARLSGRISFFGLTAVGLAISASASPIARFFVPSDEAVVAAGGSFLRIVAPSFGFIGLQLAFAGVFRASGNMVTTMVLALLSQWGIQLPIAYYLSVHAELADEGVWLAFPISNVTIAVITAGWFLRGDWKQRRLSDEQQQVEAVTEEILIEEGLR